MRSAILSALIIVVGLTVIWQVTDGLQALTSEGARRIAVARDRPPVPDARLQTMDGSALQLKPQPGKLALIEFIYTTCPTICRVGGAHLNQVRDQLLQRGLGHKVKIVSVSFDLETDGVEELKMYGDSHNADGTVWTVARPAQHKLTALLKSFGVTVIPDADGGFEHNAAIHVVDDKARMVAIVDIDDVSGAVAAAERNLR